MLYPDQGCGSGLFPGNAGCDPGIPNLHHPSQGYLSSSILFFPGITQEALLWCLSLNCWVNAEGLPTGKIVQIHSSISQVVPCDIFYITAFTKLIIKCFVISLDV